jgi:hypothetical protein
MDLAPGLIRLAEEMPASEEMGLSMQLRELMVEVPATIAADLIHGDQDNRLLPALKLVATLELIDRVYPALDTADTKAAINNLVEQLASPSFATAPVPAPTAESSDLDPTAEPAEPAVAEATTDSIPTLAPAPETPEVVEPTEAPASEPTHVSVQPAQPVQEDANVHQDSAEQA